MQQLAYKKRITASVQRCGTKIRRLKYGQLSTTVVIRIPDVPGNQMTKKTGIKYPVSEHFRIQKHLKIGLLVQFFNVT